MKKLLSMILLLGALGIFTATTVIADDTSSATEKKASKGKTLKVRKATKEEIGKSEICAVTGAKFEIAEDTPVIDYKGKAYYFCCTQCLKDFKKNPDKYAK